MFLCVCFFLFYLYVFLCVGVGVCERVVGWEGGLDGLFVIVDQT